MRHSTKEEAFRGLLIILTRGLLSIVPRSLLTRGGVFM